MNVFCASISKHALVWKQSLTRGRFYNPSLARIGRYSIDRRLTLQYSTPLIPGRSQFVPENPKGIPENSSMGSRRSSASTASPKEGSPQEGDNPLTGDAKGDIIDLTVDDASSTVSAESANSERAGTDLPDNSANFDASAIVISDDDDVSPPPISATRKNTTVTTSMTTEEHKPMTTNKDETRFSHSNALGLLGIDRKKQEEERLERLAKRKLADTQDPQASDAVTKLAKTAPLSSPTSIANPVYPGSVQDINSAIRDAQQSSDSRPSLQYPRGIVKKTWAFSQPRMGDDIKMEEVVQKHTPGIKPIDLAVISSFQWETDWLLPKFEIGRTRFLLIMGAKTEPEVGYFFSRPKSKRKRKSDEFYQ